MLILIDNYDSFTYNLYHYLSELGEQVEVYRNDQISSDEVISMNPSHIVISPGPCDPDQAGICLDLIKKAAGKIALLGVCLGHQAIGQAFGAKIIRAQEPVHGKVHKIYHQNSGVFRNIPSPFNATRYHSLIIDKSCLSPDFAITAHTEDGMIMAIAHKEYNLHGVQFHPESIASEYGHELLKNFLTA